MSKSNRTQKKTDGLNSFSEPAALSGILVSSAVLLGSEENYFRMLLSV